MLNVQVLVEELYVPYEAHVIELLNDAPDKAEKVVVALIEGLKASRVGGECPYDRISESEGGLVLVLKHAIPVRLAVRLEHDIQEVFDGVLSNPS